MAGELKLSYWAVAYIDLLGQSDRMRQISHVPKTPAEGKEFLALMNGITGLVSTLGILMPAFLAKRRPFRCGVDIGLGSEMNPGELYGPGLQNAYLLESTIVDIDGYVN